MNDQQHNAVFTPRDWAAWADWEAEFERTRPVDLHRNLAVVDALYAQARKLGVLPSTSPLAGVEHKSRMAWGLNVHGPA